MFDYSSVDVIPCEFCDYPIELDRVMEHQVRANVAGVKVEAGLMEKAGLD